MTDLTFYTTAFNNKVNSIYSSPNAVFSLKCYKI